jgi:hypothetical protein
MRLFSAGRPAWRLPDRVVETEGQRILALGARVETECQVGS